MRRTYNSDAHFWMHSWSKKKKESLLLGNKKVVKSRHKYSQKYWSWRSKSKAAAKQSCPSFFPHMLCILTTFLAFLCSKKRAFVKKTAWGGIEGGLCSSLLTKYCCCLVYWKTNTYDILVHFKLHALINIKVLYACRVSKYSAVSEIFLRLG